MYFINQNVIVWRGLFLSSLERASEVWVAITTTNDLLTAEALTEWAAQWHWSVVQWACSLAHWKCAARCLAVRRGFLDVMYENLLVLNSLGLTVRGGTVTSAPSCHCCINALPLFIGLRADILKSCRSWCRIDFLGLPIDVLYHLLSRKIV